MPTFEELLRQAQGALPPDHDDMRQVRWCGENQLLGISRQSGGGIELFLCGDQLTASSPLVRRHMRFDKWARAGGDVFQANRLVFPADDHYIAVAAFLAEELLRRGIDTSLAGAFARTEPIIEMALRRIALSEEEILGLLGELRFLEVLLSVAGEGKKAIVLDSWRGHERSSRDFVFGRRSVEVKATRRDRSVHSIGNVMQVDPRRSESNEPQEELFLLSLGFAPTEPGAEAGVALSLPVQVEEILARLSTTASEPEGAELRSLFLAKVASYGGDASRGYEHQEMREWSTYKVAWQHRFLRVYDMSDSAIQVFRRQDIAQHPHVVLDSVGFDIDLPDRVSGDLNPQTDPFALARRLVA